MRIRAFGATNRLFMLITPARALSAEQCDTGSTAPLPPHQRRWARTHAHVRTLARAPYAISIRRRCERIRNASQGNILHTFAACMHGMADRNFGCWRERIMSWSTCTLANFRAHICARNTRTHARRHARTSERSIPFTLCARGRSSTAEHRRANRDRVERLTNIGKLLSI